MLNSVAIAVIVNVPVTASKIYVLTSIPIPSRMYYIIPHLSFIHNSYAYADADTIIDVYDAVESANDS